jgi:hypothetical protein
MSAALLDDLLAAFVMPTPAKAANPANRQQLRGVPADPAACEALRISANTQPGPDLASADSQVFAAVRNPANGPESEEWPGFSQDSQDSQGLPRPSTNDLEAVAWTDADMARFHDRRARLLRWCWPEAEAERWAARLVLRDREADPRVSCADCGAYRPGRCGNHRPAGLLSPEVGRDWVALLQRCPGFQTVR